MIRKTHTNSVHSAGHDYKHRSSMYVSRAVRGPKPKVGKKSPVFVEAVNVIDEARQAEEALLKLIPPKKPTPSVVLRQDLIHKQRTHNTL